jgi:hypothetical protein
MNIPKRASLNQAIFSPCETARDETDGDGLVQQPLMKTAMEKNNARASLDFMPEVCKKTPRAQA